MHLNTVATGGAIPNLMHLLQRAAPDFGLTAEIVFGRGPYPDDAPAHRVGRIYSQALDLLVSRIFDSAGRSSRSAAESVLKRFKRVPPSLVHIHNLHGYWMNLDSLLRGLSRLGIPVVWTLHDYWPITGHCAYFESIGCKKWMSECIDCPQSSQYPKAYSDNSRRNFGDKRDLYNDLREVHLVAVSEHAKRLLRHSILARFPITTIYNAVDTSIFRPTAASRQPRGTNVVGCVARHWDERKGLSDVIELRRQLGTDFEIVVVGLSDRQIRDLPDGIVGVPPILTVSELAAKYCSMDVFFNPSREETFGMTTLEAMACGIPVVLYDVSANRELQPAFASEGLVRRGDISAAAEAIRELVKRRSTDTQGALVRHVSENFSQEAFIRRYFRLYRKLLKS